MPNRKIAAKFAAPLALAMMIAACGSSDAPAEQQTAQAAETDDNDADSMRSRDGEAQAADTTPDSEERPIMQAQVILDRLGFSPGVIDGKIGMSTNNALEAFQKANDLSKTGEYDDATREALLGSVAEAAGSANGEQPPSEREGMVAPPMPPSGRPIPQPVPATRVVTIPEEFAIGRFEELPDDPAKQAEMSQLGYESLEEKLAERFHTTVETLRMLNPNGAPAGSAPASGQQDGGAEQGAGDGSSSETESAEASSFRAGQQIRVPNIGADYIDASADIDSEWRSTLRNLGIGSDQPQAARIVVDESESTLIAYDENDRIVGAFTVTSGSSRDPLPIGEWDIYGIARNPPFSYDPSLFWDVPDDQESQQLPPGPNGPVGVVWIDLSKEHYGIHGTSAPETIGRAQSHGCVRLTNWDAARLAQMVDQSTEVIFQK
ncbi:L,D-transpeptidase family protein [Croceicoccus marinus]|nr:L,D-transpeptidase family protein [Croceicoccus marinus]